MSLADDWIKDYNASKIKYGAAQGEFYHENEVYCPYCGHEQKDAWECLPDSAETWGECDCEKCEKTFKLSYEHVYNTKTLEKSKI